MKKIKKKLMKDLLQKTPQNYTTFLNLKRSNPINKLIFWVKNIINLLTN